jgi:hypothetical protein
MFILRGGACSAHGGDKKCITYTISVEKPEKKRQLGRLKRRWEDNIKMDLGENYGRLWTRFTWLRLRTKRGGGGMLHVVS